MGEITEKWFDAMSIERHCKKTNPQSRFTNYLVKNGYADKGLLEWEIKDDIASYWKDKYGKSQDDGPFKQYRALSG